MTDVAYAVVHLLQAGPGMQLAPGEKLQIVGTEEQTTKLVMSITEAAKFSSTEG